MYVRSVPLNSTESFRALIRTEISCVYNGGIECTLVCHSINFLSTGTEATETVETIFYTQGQTTIKYLSFFVSNYVVNEGLSTLERYWYWISSIQFCVKNFFPFSHIEVDARDFLEILTNLETILHSKRNWFCDKPCFCAYVCCSFILKICVTKKLICVAPFYPRGSSMLTQNHLSIFQLFNNFLIICVLYEHLFYICFRCCS